MLNLYPHNQRTYIQMCDIIAAHNRVAVEQATGTGKSFLYHKYAQDHLHEKMLVITPHSYIIDEQRRAIQAADPGFDFSNIIATTYTQLMYHAKKDCIPSGFNIIVFDEMHHLGAEKWGMAARALIEYNPGATLIGLSATPVRTDGRDMIDELFDEATTTPYTVIDAWSDGVLPIPTYVVGAYALTDRVQKVGTTIARLTDDELRQQTLAEYNHLKQIIAKGAVNIDRLIDKHIYSKNPHPKVIVFCPTLVEMEIARSRVYDWFGKPNQALRTWRVSSRLPDEENDRSLREFSEVNDPSTTHVMFCVDCIGEGVHITGVDAIIMMRTTGSVNVYLQQMGRCLEAGRTTRPVILDLVDNIGTVGTTAFIRRYVKNTVTALIKQGVFSERLDDGIASGATPKEIAEAITDELVDVVGGGTTLAANPGVNFGEIMNAVLDSVDITTHSSQSDVRTVTPKTPLRFEIIDETKTVREILDNIENIITTNEKINDIIGRIVADIYARYASGELICPEDYDINVVVNFLEDNGYDVAAFDAALTENDDDADNNGLSALFEHD